VLALTGVIQRLFRLVDLGGGEISAAELVAEAGDFGMRGRRLLAGRDRLGGVDLVRELARRHALEVEGRCSLDVARVELRLHRDLSLDRIVVYELQRERAGMLDIRADFGLEADGAQVCKGDPDPRREDAVFEPQEPIFRPSASADRISPDGAATVITTTPRDI
jgi:hypothetical protein